MKKYFNLLFISLILISCETKVEAEKFAGKWLMEGDRFGLGYSAGDQKDADFVMKFMNAYSDKNAELMVEMSADTVKFHPADLSGVFDIDMTNTDFIVERQSNWDSISRDLLCRKNSRILKEELLQLYFRKKDL